MDTCLEINNRIQQAAERAALIDGVPATDIVRFLKSGESHSTASSGLYSRAKMELDCAYGRAEKAALRTLFDLLSELLPAEARLTVAVDHETIRQRVEPMVKGLVPNEWEEVAMQELTNRSFVLNLPGARVALEAELSTGYTRTACNVMWAFFADFGLIPNHVIVEFEGVSGGSYAHCRWSAYHSKDLYCDVVVHEAAHLLHYLKPERFELPVPKGKERFVDVDFNHRELFAYACEAFTSVTRVGGRASRIQFAESMRDEAFSFPSDEIGTISDLVMAAARARNGWHIIRDATVIRRRRRFPLRGIRTVTQAESA